MPVVTPLSGIRRKFAFMNIPLSFLAVEIEDANLVAPDCRNIAFVKKYKFPRYRQKRCYVRSDKILVNTKAKNYRAATARHNKAIRVLPANHGKCECTFQLRDRFADSLEQIVRLLHVVMDPMRHNLGVGFGVKLVAVFLEIGSQAVMILDNPVVNQRHAVG